MTEKPSQQMVWNRCSLLPGVVLLCFSFFLTMTASGALVGVNLGMDGDDLPTPNQMVEFMLKQGITHIRIFDTNAAILKALAGSSIQVTVGIPNVAILSVGQSNASAANWVQKNILAYLPDTNITGISVGRQVLTDYPALALALVPTMQYIRAALVASNLDTFIKVSTPHSMALLLDSFPPSQAFFNLTYSKSVMQPLLNFLSQSGSYFMINVYPLEVYQKNYRAMTVDYALFLPNTGVVDPNTNLQYHNAFDAVIDACFSAMAALNHTDLPIVVSETGWPSKGDEGDVGVSAENAKLYSNNLVKHILNNTGTPRRPGISINTYIYELFNEDKRQGATVERNYGIYYPDMSPVYPLDLSSTQNGTIQTWCVAKRDANVSSLQAALDYACGVGGADCSAIQNGQSCFSPNTVVDHSSFAFNSYYQKHGKATGTCDFAGVASISTTDPSYGQCIYPSSATANQTYLGLNHQNSSAFNGWATSITLVTCIATSNLLLLNMKL